MLSYINEQGTEIMIDAKSAETTRKINGDYTLSFVTINEPDLAEELIVICEGQKYRIKQLSSIMSGNKTLQNVTCKHISSDLIDYYAYDYLTNTIMLDDALEFLFEDTPFTYAIRDSIKSQSFEKLGEMNKQKLLAKIIDTYGLEYEVDNYHFIFKEKVGYETEFQFRYKANISNVKKDIDTTSLTTYIKGYGKKDDEGNYLCTAEYTSPNAEKFGVRHADPVFDERFTIKEELLEYIKTKINDTPDIVVELDYTQIDATQPINLGDYGYLIHEPLQLDLLSRVIEITKKLSTDKQGKNYQNMTYKIGSQKLVKSSFETNKDSITGSIDIDKVQSELEASKQEATDKINSGLGGYVTKTSDELLIMDTEDKDTARNLWRWNINGLGFSSNGYSGPYTTAITNDGKIVADFITVGSLSANLIKTGSLSADRISGGILASKNKNLQFDLNEGRLIYYEGSRFVGATNRLYDNWTGKYGLGMLANTDSFVAFSTGEQDYATIYNPELVIVGKDTVNKDTREVRYKKGINIRTTVHGGDYKNIALSWGEFPRSKTDYISLYKGDGGDGTQSELILELGDDYKTNFKIMGRMYDDNSYHMVASFRATGGSEVNASSSSGINFYQNLSMQGKNIWGIGTAQTDLIETQTASVKEIDVQQLSLTKIARFNIDADVKYRIPASILESIEHFGHAELSNNYCRVDLPIGFNHQGYIVTISPLSSGNYEIIKHDEYFEVIGSIKSFDYVVKGFI